MHNRKWCVSIAVKVNYEFGSSGSSETFSSHCTCNEDAHYWDKQASMYLMRWDRRNAVDLIEEIWVRSLLTREIMTLEGSPFCITTFPHAVICSLRVHCKSIRPLSIDWSPEDSRVVLLIASFRNCLSRQRQFVFRINNCTQKSQPASHTLLACFVIVLRLIFEARVRVKTCQRPGSMQRWHAYSSLLFWEVGGTGCCTERLWSLTTKPFTTSSIRWLQSSP